MVKQPSGPMWINAKVITGEAQGVPVIFGWERPVDRGGPAG
jgi:hypothetical protein